MKCFAGLALIFLASACFGNEEEGNLFEGDIELSPDQSAAINEQLSKQGASSFAAVKAGLWKTNGRVDTIKYYINPSISEATDAIKDAIADYHKYTCIRFQKLSSQPNSPHLYFTTGTGCSSPVGRLSYGNNIKLARGCWRKGTVMHEIGHSLENKHNFNKYTLSRIDSMGEPYDYDSMMHYGSKYFNRNGKNTIQTKNAADQNRIGKRSGFSQGDIAQFKKLYCSGSGSSCVDKNTRCSSWKSHCRSNKYVMDNCKKSCNTC